MKEQRNDRGQAHTLEAVVAGMLVLGGLLFALQGTAVTPLSASTSNQHLQNQQRAMAADVLATGDANGTLEPTLVYWNASRGAFRGSSIEGYYTTAGPPTPFGKTLNETFHDERIAFNVQVSYQSGSGSLGSTRLVYMGVPSSNAVTTARTVAVFDDASINSTATVSSVAANGNFYAPDAHPDGPLFNLMEVRITVWRM